MSSVVKTPFRKVQNTIEKEEKLERKTSIMTTSIDNQNLPLMEVISGGKCDTVKFLLDTEYRTFSDHVTALKWANYIKDEKVKRKMKKILDEYLEPPEKTKKKRKEKARRKQRERQEEIQNEGEETRRKREKEEAEEFLKDLISFELQQLREGIVSEFLIEDLYKSDPIEEMLYKFMEQEKKK